MPNAEVGARADLKVIDANEIPHVLEEGVLGAAIEWMIRDPSGKVIEHVVKKSESYTQQFLQLLFVKFATISVTFTSSIRDTSNTLRNVYINPNSGAYCLDTLAAVTVTNFGIVVGTGVGAPAITDYKLGTLIAHGAGAGAMQYSGTIFGVPASDAATSQLTITRNFVANAGGITVQEAGLYCRAYDGADRYFGIIRDSSVGGLGIVVGAGNTLTINYRLQATV